MNMPKDMSCKLSISEIQSYPYQLFHGHRQRRRNDFIDLDLVRLKTDTIGAITVKPIYPR